MKCPYCETELTEEMKLEGYDSIYHCTCGQLISTVPIAKVPEPGLRGQT